MKVSHLQHPLHQLVFNLLRIRQSPSSTLLVAPALGWPSTRILVDDVKYCRLGHLECVGYLLIRILRITECKFAHLELSLCRIRCLKLCWANGLFAGLISKVMFDPRFVRLPHLDRTAALVLHSITPQLHPIVILSGLLSWPARSTLFHNQ